MASLEEAIVVFGVWEGPMAGWVAVGEGLVQPRKWKRHISLTNDEAIPAIAYSSPLLHRPSIKIAPVIGQRPQISYQTEACTGALSLEMSANPFANSTTSDRCAAIFPHVTD